MYKVEIDISSWGGDGEKITIETFDFFKVEQIQKFIDFQLSEDWTEVEYNEVDEDEAEDDEDAFDLAGWTIITFTPESDTDEQTNA